MIDLDRTLYLPLLEIAIPSLKQLSDVQYRNFMSVLTKLMVSDQQISLLEWSLFKILRNNLAPQAGRSSKTLDIGKLRQESEVLLSALASAGHATATQRLQAFASAAEYLQEKAAISYQAVDAGDIRPLDEAVDKLRLLKPLQKPMLLKAMAACINADGRVTPVEAELLQAVGSLLDCPIPPLLDGQKFI
ncbi:MAG: hypothetical protein WD601_04130 [Pseudohongiellaceae bacterium]